MAGRWRDDFIRDGFVKVEGAFPPDVAAECAAILWSNIDAEPDAPETWTQPVYWIGGRDEAPFVAAANTTVLHEAFDELVGPGRWVPRPNLGSFPLRFPHDDEPNDAGWHIEGSFPIDGSAEYRMNLWSEWRALLMLFLFTEVDERTAPTRIRVGSHLDVPPVLAPHGRAGLTVMAVSPPVAAASAHREVALATGKPGDVYLCHPFLVHAAQPNHGTRPRFMAQPPLHPREPVLLHRAEADLSPVELTIRDSLVAAGLPVPA